MMISRLTHTATILGLLAVITACSADDALTGPLDNASQTFVRRVTMTAPDFVAGDGETDTRTDVTIGQSGAKFQWSNNDTIGIFPDQGFQTAFPILPENAGTNTATFDGGGWALRQSHHYVAYYPFVRSISFGYTEVPISYLGQHQTGNNTTGHLGQCDFMTADATTPEAKGVSFNFSHKSVLTSLDVIVVKPTTVDKVTLLSKNPIFLTKGTMNLNARSSELLPSETSTSITLTTSGISSTRANEMLQFYMMLPPVDMRGQDVYLRIGSHSVKLPEKKGPLMSGKAYKFRVTLDNTSLQDNLDYLPDPTYNVHYPTEEAISHSNSEIGSTSLRRISSIQIGSQTIELHNDNHLFVDLTSQKFTVNRGEELTCRIFGKQRLNWIFGYIYIDEDHDGFSAGIDPIDHYTPWGDLKAHSGYNYNKGNVYLNSSGVKIHPQDVIAPLTFKAPSNPGTYRMRWKTDWNNIDPKGALPMENVQPGKNDNSLKSNNGTIIDVMLEVK